IDVLFEQRREEVLLAGEVPVQSALRIPGLGGDLVDSGLAVAAAREYVQSRRQQLLARLSTLGPCGACTPVHAARSRAGLACLHLLGIVPTDWSVCTSST